MSYRALPIVHRSDVEPDILFAVHVFSFLCV